MPRNGFDVLKTKEAILKIEKEMAEPDFWNHRESAEKKSQELSQLKKRIAEYEQYAGEVGSLIEMLQIADEGMVNEIAERARKLKKNFDKFMLLKRFTNPYDKGNAVLSIFAGAGGKDSEDWVAMLRRMYERWAEIGGYGTAAVHEHWGEQNGPSGWGLKNVSILVKGAYAYGYLKRESGVHRLVRISPFSSQSLRHTSFALVEVLPEFVAPEEVELKPDELRIDFFRSSGPGGQNVNKRETAVRITHVPTGLNVSVQAGRTQEGNREIAMEMLRAKLYQKKLKEQKKERETYHDKTASIEWGHQIRSYVLHPYKMVKDHRTGHETTQAEKVLEGELDEFIEEELKQI
ncbi:MAG: peptide chain release factor 2 [Candidatus Sungbacteria bacterium RIFCSPHIGHO2_02_FULL_46_12]|nr:MAG: peptide chain release factor 2 [Candidatus Sungbacteria bacterium RIFCSPHIGHO2_02_FULL_46_12]